MNLDITKFNEVANAAKAKTNDKRWQNAIDKAVAGVVSGWWVITELADSVAVTTETGKTYFANGSCQCRAAELGQPCKHRALARLLALYHEAETAPAPARYCGDRDLQHLDRCKPHITRSIQRRVESDYTGAHYTAVYCDGWHI